MKRSRHTWALLALALFPLATSVTSAVPARASAPSPWGGCASVKVVGVRGTTEDFSDDTLGMGTEMYQLFNKVKDDLPGVQVVGTGLWYPAAQWTSAKFFQSIGAGVTQLIMAMDAEAQELPAEDVLIGYSQGAAVLGDYLDDVSSTSAATNILAARRTLGGPELQSAVKSRHTSVRRSDHLAGGLGPRDNTAEQRDYPSGCGITTSSASAWRVIRSAMRSAAPISATFPFTARTRRPASCLTAPRTSPPWSAQRARSGCRRHPRPLTRPRQDQHRRLRALYGLFDYNPSTGASFVDLPDGLGGWAGIRGPAFSTGWNVYPGDFDGGGLTDLFVYNPTSGASYVELADGNGGWTGVKGPTFSPGWNVYTGNLDGNNRTDLFVYNSISGASYVELADGSGGWTGVQGPTFSGWSIYPGVFSSS